MKKIRKRIQKNIDFKIFSNIKNKESRCIKVLGFKVFEKSVEGNFCVQEFLGNLVYTEKLRTDVKETKVVKIFNFPISERIVENDIVKYNMFGFTLEKIDLQNVFYKKYLKNIKFDYDDVYILNANSGEAFLFFAYCAKTFLNKNNSKKPLFVATQKYHVDILNMYFPDANIIYLKDFQVKIKSNKWIINNHNCYMIFSPKHFVNVEKEACEEDIGQVHYLDSIDKTLNISKQEHTKPVVKISQHTKLSLDKKINLMHLNLNNFVIIAPEARTCEALPYSLWKNVANELRKRGVDIFLNVLDNENFIEGCKSAFLTYQEIYYLATQAKAVISLRSGFTEFLVPCEIPNITVYTKFRNRKKYIISVEKTISAFSMHKFPFVNHDLICELNINDFKNENELLNSIIDNFDKMAMRKVQTI